MARSGPPDLTLKVLRGQVEESAKESSAIPLCRHVGSPPTTEQAEAALAYLSAIDPLMFEIAMNAADLVAGVTPRDEAAGDDEAVPV